MAVNNNKRIDIQQAQQAYASIKVNTTKSQMKTQAQQSIFNQLDKNGDGKIDANELKNVVSGRIKNKEGKFVERKYIKIGNLPNGRSRVLDANGKEWVMAHDGTILKAEYVKQNPNGAPKTKTQYKVSNDKLKAMNTLIKDGKSAKASFDKQLAQDGWAGDLADGISTLWGSDNRASKVRKDLQKHNSNMKALKDAAQKGDDEFNATFKKIYGVDYNQKAVENYDKANSAYEKALQKHLADPKNKQYEKDMNTAYNNKLNKYNEAFGTKQKNISDRVEKYNQS